MPSPDLFATGCAFPGYASSGATSEKAHAFKNSFDRIEIRKKDGEKSKELVRKGNSYRERKAEKSDWPMGLC